MSDSRIPEGADILVGVDGARTFDTTAVGWCWIRPDGRKLLRAHVWSVRRGVPYHTFVDGGELDNEQLVEPFIHDLNRRHRVRAIAYDPRYFGTEAKHLSNEGFVVVKVEPNSTDMGDAVALFERDALNNKLAHDGDRVLAMHIAAVDATRRPDQSKKIGKRSKPNPIDAAMSVVLANYLTSVDLPEPRGEEPLFAWA